MILYPWRIFLVSVVIVISTWIILSALSAPVWVVVLVAAFLIWRLIMWARF